MLKESITLSDGTIVPAGTPGAIVEVLDRDEVYIVELFGEWVTLSAQGTLVASQPNAPDSFRETLGVADVSPDNLCLLQPAAETVGPRVQLLSMVETLPDTLLEEVLDFAEYVLDKHQRQHTASIP
jgi:hypothetical protein